MRRLLLAGVLLIGTSSILSAAEVRIDEHTLCPVALHAFDEKDLPAIEEFFRFVQGVFDELNARHTDQEETAPIAKLTGKSMEVPILGTPYITGYEPIKDSSGAEIGVYYVGYKK